MSSDNSNPTMVEINNNSLIIKKVLGYENCTFDADYSNNNIRLFLQNIQKVLGYAGFSSDNSDLTSLKSISESNLTNIRHLLTILSCKKDSQLVQKLLNDFQLTEEQLDLIVKKSDLDHIVKQSDLESLKNELINKTTDIKNIYNDIHNIQGQLNAGLKVSSSSLNNIPNVSISQNNRKTIGDVLNNLDTNYQSRHAEAIIQTYNKVNSINFNVLARNGEYSTILNNIHQDIINKLPNLTTFNNAIASIPKQDYFQQNIVVKIGEVSSNLDLINKNVIAVNSKLDTQHQAITSKFDSIQTTLNDSLKQSSDNLLNKIQNSSDILENKLQKSTTEIEKTQGLINASVVSPLNELKQKQDQFNQKQQEILTILDDRLRKPVENTNADEDVILEMADYGVRILEELTSMAREYARKKDQIGHVDSTVQQTVSQKENELKEKHAEELKNKEKEIINNYINSYCNQMQDLDSLYDSSSHAGFIQKYIRRDEEIYKNNQNSLVITDSNRGKIHNSDSISNQFKVEKSCFYYKNFLEIIQWATVKEISNVPKNLYSNQIGDSSTPTSNKRI